MNDTLVIPDKYRDEMKDLRLFDDRFFKIAVRDKRVARVILDALFDDVSSMEIQDQQSIGFPGRRSVVYDIHTVSDHENMNVEIEKNPLSPLRVRYHASVLDVDASKPNMEFKDMKGIKVIFICDFDPMNKGLDIYHIRDTVDETGEAYEDRRELILVNGNASNNERLAKIMHDLRATEASDMHNPVLKEVMTYYKNTKKGIDDMSEIWDRIEERGKTESNVNAIKNIMVNFNLNIIDAMKGLNIPEEDYVKYQELILK